MAVLTFITGSWLPSAGAMFYPHDPTRSFPSLFPTPSVTTRDPAESGANVKKG